MSLDELWGQVRGESTERVLKGSAGAPPPGHRAPGPAAPDGARRRGGRAVAGPAAGDRPGGRVPAARGERHGPDEAVPGALAAATVYLPDEGADIAVYTDADGRFVPVLTHPDHAPANVPRLRPVNAAELARLLPPDLALKLNPGGRVSVRVPVSDVRAAADRLGH